MLTPTIRELNLYDLAGRGFYESLKSLTGEITDLTYLDAKDILFKRKEQGLVTLVAVLNEEVVGTGSIFIEQKFIHNGGKVGHIEDVAIDEQYQRNGIGKMLVEELLARAKKEGCYKCILHCSESVLRFYEKLDFYSRTYGMRIDLINETLNG